MISDAALGRLERASARTKHDGDTITVLSDDVFAAVREIRTLRRKADVGDRLKHALATIGEALREEL